MTLSAVQHLSLLGSNLSRTAQATSRQPQAAAGVGQQLQQAGL
jgi:hypothetical protein